MSAWKRMTARAMGGLVFLAACGWVLSAAPSIAGETTARLKVLSFNTWYDGTKVEGGFDKLAKAITESGADVACLQESSAKTSRRLAERLGWHSVEGCSGSVQIVSRYPVEEVITAGKPGSDRFIGARLRLGDPTKPGLMVFNVHLDFRNYGPYAARQPGATAASVLAENGKSERASQMRGALETMCRFLENANERPVILTGDFNVPSHLDWTPATSSAHGGVGAVAWPESLLVEKAGLIDAFRACHPDPVLTPGNSWSSIHKGDEPQDRIDFIHHKGSLLKIVDCKLFTTTVETTVGAWSEGATEALGNTWPSDHSAVLATFEWTGSSAGSR